MVGFRTFDEATVDAAIDRTKSQLTQICDKFSLSFTIDEDVPVEFQATVPKQSGLTFEFAVQLQNNDELWLFADETSFCAFPIEEHGDAFFRSLELLIDGNGRIAKYTQGRWRIPYQIRWENLENGVWTEFAADLKFFRLPGIGMNEPIVIVQNVRD